MAKKQKVNEIAEGHEVGQVSSFTEIVEGTPTPAQVFDEPTSVPTPVFEEPTVAPVEAVVEVAPVPTPDTYTLDRKKLNKLFFCLSSIGTAKMYLGMAGIMRVGELFGCTTNEEALVEWQRIQKEFHEAQ
jgi:hypothetical protein